MKEAKRHVWTWLLAAAALLPALAGCEFRPGLANTSAPSMALSDVESFLQDFAHQALAAFLF